MNNLKNIFVATSNKGKIKEFAALFKQLGIEIIPATDYNIASPEETGNTFLENAILKAKYYSQFVPYPCFADDSGLCIEALDNQPGIHSARWSQNGDFAFAINKIENMLRIKNLNTSKAKYVCSLALYNKGKITTSEGTLEGIVQFPSSGNNGFGYDPIFIPNGYNKTLSEISEQAKNQISHRAQAFNNLFNSNSLK